METWMDLIWCQDPEQLERAAQLAEKVGRQHWADAFRESAEKLRDSGE